MANAFVNITSPQIISPRETAWPEAAINAVLIAIDDPSDDTLREAILQMEAMRDECCSLCNVFSPDECDGEGLCEDCA